MILEEYRKDIDRKYGRQMSITCNKGSITDYITVIFQFYSILTPWLTNVSTFAFFINH